MPTACLPTIGAAMVIGTAPACAEARWSWGLFANPSAGGWCSGRGGMTRTAGKAIGDQLVRLGPGRVHPAVSAHGHWKRHLGDRLPPSTRQSDPAGSPQIRGVNDG